eukprot:m.86890 g.86890  ORF g.86890 m.86890 type:complete len:212 (+) comp19881_c0_seq1:100-735(+)
MESGSSVAESWNVEETEVESVVKEGEMRKRAIGKGRLGRTNWRTRWFRLTDSALSYYTDKLTDTPKGAICTAQMHQVRPSEQVPNAFELIHYHFNAASGEISQKEYMLLCDCGSGHKRDEWILVLKEAIHALHGKERTQSMIAQQVRPDEKHDLHEWRPATEEEDAKAGAGRPRLATNNFSGFEDDEVAEANPDSVAEEPDHGFGSYLEDD